MNKLTTAKRAAVIAALVEGNSIRATARMTDVSKPTILKLLADLGQVCVAYHDVMVRDVAAQRVQCDEIWSFVGCKQKNVRGDDERGYRGDLWTWTAIDADSKLMIAWNVGAHNLSSAYTFMADLAGRLANRIQLTTDGNSQYLNVMEETFGSNVDYAVLQKHYADQSRGRYSPARFMGATREVIKGSPDPNYISTSYVERANLTMRMSMRRFTRLTNGFSKKAENHAHAVALNFMHYNFCRIHRTLRVTPAMASGLSDHVWSLDELIGLLEAAEKKAA
jgi:IS1 family transposase